MTTGGKSTAVVYFTFLNRHELRIRQGRLLAGTFAGIGETLIFENYGLFGGFYTASLSAHRRPQIGLAVNFWCEVKSTFLLMTYINLSAG